MLCKQGVGGSSPPSSTCENILLKITDHARVPLGVPLPLPKCFAPVSRGGKKRLLGGGVAAAVCLTEA
jgi:hypothetical protein